MDDPFRLVRFLDAQAPVIERVRDELRDGRKRSHWMWFVFPQIAGLGHSPTARFYALASLDEARAFLSHPVLGPRLLAMTDLICGHQGRSATAILGPPDDRKLRSSMTLFAEAAATPEPFRRALDRFFGGAPDPATLECLREPMGEPTRR